MSSVRHLIVVCSNFPFGFGEPFLEVELDYLRQRFDRITICNTSVVGTERQFELPNEVNVVSVSPTVSLVHKLLSLPIAFFRKEIREEMAVIRKAYHSQVSWGKLKTMMVSWLRAQAISKAVSSQICSDEETFLYSYWTDDGALAITLLKEQDSKLTVFSRLHGWDLYFERSTYYYLPFRKKIFNGLNAVFAISENGRNYLLSHFDSIISGGRIYQSRLGIRTADMPERHSREFRRFRIISCSNLIPIKRVHLIVKALALVEDLEVTWTHFGDGSEADSIRSLTERTLGTKENIAFHFPGRIPNWKVLEYYRTHMVDLFISLSRYDGIPVSIMEAMSFGIPALATNVGGVSEIVINGSTGFLLDQEVDPKEVAQVISHVAAMDSDRYDAMRDQAKKMWGTFYSADVNYPDFCDRVLALKKLDVNAS